MVAINSWADSLTEFLKSSNEDERVIALFRESILSELKHSFADKALNWLEIGIGDGNKTLGFAQTIISANCFQKINLTICEPSLDWIVKIESSDIERKIHETAEVDFVKTTIEEFVASGHVQHYDFISMVQVMYSASTKNALLDYVDSKPKYSPSLIWVDVEDISSDFNLMRQQLISREMNVVHSFVDEYLSDLKNRNITFKTFKTTNKICRIDAQDVLINDNHWIFPFILGYSSSDFDKMNSSDRNLVFNTVRSFVKNLKQPILSIPDLSILAFV